jgi:hypothetical protein
VGRTDYPTVENDGITFFSRGEKTHEEAFCFLGEDGK